MQCNGYTIVHATNQVCTVHCAPNNCLKFKKKRILCSSLPYWNKILFKKSDKYVMARLGISAQNHTEVIVAPLMSTRR